MEEAIIGRMKDRVGVLLILYSGEYVKILNLSSPSTILSPVQTLESKSSWNSVFVPPFF